MHACVYVCIMCVCIHVYVCMHNISGELSGWVNVLPKTGGGIVRGTIARGVNCPTPGGGGGGGDDDGDGDGEIKRRHRLLT